MEDTVKKEEVVVPTKFAKIVSEIESMSVLDLNELVKVFENKFGVSATAVATGPATAGPAEEEKSTATVELTDGGANKIAIIIRTYISMLRCVKISRFLDILRIKAPYVQNKHF